MNVYEAYRLAIETGMRNDPRPQSDIEAALREAAEERDKLPESMRPYFDEERLWNPYADSRFMWGEELARETEAERFMWGIDIGTAEILLADRLRERGEELSAVIAHHPTGRSRTCFPEVMWMQTGMYDDVGIPINVLEDLVGQRMAEVKNNVLGSNYNQPVDAARLLGVLMCNIHSPADNMVQKYMGEMFEAAEPRTLDDIVDRLMEEPEFRAAAGYNDPPKILAGSGKSRCGTVISKMTGGTSGPKELYERLSLAGVGTVVGMHFSKEHVEECKKHHINVVVSGHMASDSLGMNLIGDVWEREGIELIGCSGFTRFSRN